MIDRIRHRGVHADIPQLADPIDAQRVDVVILLRDQDDVDVANVAFTGIRYSARSVLT